MQFILNLLLLDPSDTAVESKLNLAEDIQDCFCIIKHNRARPREDNTDFTLICNDERLPVHKTILSARSDVLRAMLRHGDMEEGSTSEQKMDDVEPKVLRLFIA